MKQLACLLLLALAYLPTQGQAVGQSPPHTLALGSGVFMDSTEISNLHWLEYLYYLKRDSLPAVYYRNLPDTSVWQALSPRPEAYFNNPAYRHYPVVGISYKQAQAYCRWRSRIVTNVMNSNLSFRQAYALSDNQYFKVIYRLPTEEEWTQAAQGTLSNDYGLSEPYSPIPRKWKAKEFYPRRINEALSYPEFKKLFKQLKKQNILPGFVSLFSFSGLFAFRYDTPMAIHQGVRNKAGFRNMVGNVAEMTAERGIAKGGSFVHTPQECRISQQQVYLRPQPWLGFRCVAELVIIEL